MNKIVSRIYGIAFVMGVTCSAQAQIITTVAGTGVAGYGGDDGSSYLAKLKVPSGLAADTLGNIYIADKDNNRIRKIDTKGLITTIAGNGVTGFNVDGVDAKDAKLSFPSSVALDSAGNIYIADMGNQRIRKIDHETGKISTIAGTGVTGYNGDKIPATDAQLHNPNSVAVDRAGNVYFSESWSSLVRKIDMSTGYIYTIAGINTKTIDDGDGGPATAAVINRPNCIAFDRNDNLYLVEDFSHAIRVIDTAGKIHLWGGQINKSGFTGDGENISKAAFYSPKSIAFDKKNQAYITDYANHRLRRVDTTGKIMTIAGYGSPGHAGDGGDATSAKLSSPLGVTLDKYDNLYLTEGTNYLRYIFINKILSDTSDFTIFPNPTSGDFSICLTSKKEEKVTVVIYNDAGQRIREVYVPTNNILSMHLDMPGLYFLYGISQHTTWKGKVIVMH